MRLLCLLITLLMLGLSTAAHALQPDKSFRHYVRNNWSIEHGLPQISALAIAQDHQGYVWVGTQSGLARFDGVRFVNYSPETEPALPGVWMRSLHTARDGRLWIGTYKGVASYVDGRFTAVPAVDPDRWPDLEVHGFADDGAGSIWAATGAGLFQAKGGRLHPVGGSPPLAHSVLQLADGLWVGGRGAVHHRRSGQWRSWPLPQFAATAAVNRLLYAQGRLWAATSQGLFARQGAQWLPVPDAPQLAQVPLELLFTDRDGNLWVGGDVGLARFRDGALLEFVNAGDLGGIKGVRSAHEDREGNLWVGSQSEGLTRLWDGWTRRYSQAEGLEDPVVWSVSPDPDGERTWVGGNEGVSLLRDGRFSRVAQGGQLPHPQGYNLLAEPGRLWIGTRRGLAVIDHDGPRAGRVQQPETFAAMAGAQINGLVRGADGALWIPTSEGLYRYTSSGDGPGVLSRYGREQGLRDPKVRYFHQTRKGRILAGTQSGLFEQVGDRFVAVGTDAQLPEGLDITAIAELDDGRLVIGALDERSFFEHGGRWHALAAQQGMPGNAPFFLTPHAGYLWAAGIRGITRVPLADLAALAEGRMERVRGEMLLNERGDPGSGQQGYCCNGAGNAKGFLRDGALWLPSRDGVVAMDTGAISKNRVPPPVVIERVQFADAWHAAADVSGSELQADSRDLGFEFSVLSFQEPASAGLEYRLRGYDRDWRVANPEIRNTRYTNLPPGDYVFEVRGKNNAGVPSAVSAELAFAIAPRFHETSVFAALLVALALLLVFAGYRYQRHRHRAQQHALESLVQQRTEALEQANERLREASQTDPLTGLRNRRYMSSQIPTDLAYYDRQVLQGEHPGEVMLFALIDIDHFKGVNDRYGHKAGDLVLQQFAQVLEGLVRTGDYVARWGGEEFLLVFRPMPTRNLQIIGGRLRDAVAGHAFDIGDGQVLRLTGSIGLSEYPLFRDSRGNLGWETMVELADQAMYYVKTHGRDGWAAFRPTDRTRVSSLMQELHPGPGLLLDSGELQLLGSKVATHTT
ncbi:MAG: diguanylate cyclase [Pseudomonadota bacterium]|nr:diguanylate cyclase [Pseudomonadota bacterium]